ncbi:hypothetical protein TSMEX_001229, partial [Taenia solium]
VSIVGANTMIYFYVPLQSGFCSRLWGGYAVPLLITSLSIIGVLVILLVSLSLLLLTYRNGKQKFVHASCIDEESLLCMEKTPPFHSPPTSDADEDVLFDKVRDVFVPKFTRSDTTSAPKLTPPPTGAVEGTSVAAATYDDEFVRYPFYNQRVANKVAIRAGTSDAHNGDSSDGQGLKENPQTRSLDHHLLESGLAEMLKDTPTGQQATLHHQAEVEGGTGQVPESVVGRVVMTLALQTPERSGDASFLQAHIDEVRHLPLRLASNSSILRPEKFYIKAKLVSKCKWLLPCISIVSMSLSSLTQSHIFLHKTSPRAIATANSCNVPRLPWVLKKAMLEQSVYFRGREGFEATDMAQMSEAEA